MLSVMAILTATLTPAVYSYVEQARRSRAIEDTSVIADAIQSFITDTAEKKFLQLGHGASDENPPDRSETQRVDLLVSDGDIPTLGAAVAAEFYWTSIVSGTTVDTLSNHLVENAPGDSTANRYRNPTDISLFASGGNNIDFANTVSGGFNAPHAWRGPYLRGPVSADPWGNRYAANVAFLDPVPSSIAISDITAGPGPAEYPRLDVFVLSAGSDEEIDTLSAQDGAVVGDDDIFAMVGGNGR